MIKFKFFKKKKTKKKIDLNLATLVVLLVVALLVFFGLLSKKLNQSVNPNYRIHEISEVAKINKQYSAVVTKATFDNTIGPKLHLPDTEKVLVINLQITNLSDQKLNYLPIIHTFLRNQQGDTYNFTPGLTDNTMEAKLIEPGETLKGDLAFVVPANYMPLWFYLDAKFNNISPMSFRIVQ